MRVWLRYLREKRITLFLYFLTAFFFIAVGSLYHIENLEKMLYAAILTFAVWIMAGILQGLKYVHKSREMEKSLRHLRQSGDLLLEGLGERCSQAAESDIESVKSYEELQELLLFSLSDRRTKDRLGWEERSAECRDYYLMWTHQIKTPILALRLLLDKSGSGGKENFQMREELFKIEQYVEMALTFQRLEGIAGDLVLEEYILGDLVRQAVKKYSVLFINRGLGLKLEEMEYKIITDEKWFVFCVEQLLSNSIKYTLKGGITLRAERDEAAERIRFSIEDTGMGIRAEDLPRIFEKGFTGYNGRLDKKSTGIGLYLCRRIFTHLGIQIKVESEAGQGTKVILGLLYAKPSNGTGRV